MGMLKEKLSPLPEVTVSLAVTFLSFFLGTGGGTSLLDSRLAPGVEGTSGLPSRLISGRVEFVMLEVDLAGVDLLLNLESFNRSAPGVGTPPAIFSLLISGREDTSVGVELDGVPFNGSMESLRSGKEKSLDGSRSPSPPS